MLLHNNKAKEILLDPVKAQISALLEDIGFLTTSKPKVAYHGCVYENLGDKILLNAFRALFSPDFFLYSKHYWGKLLRMSGQEHTPFLVSFLGGGTLINVSKSFLELMMKCKARVNVVFGTGVADPTFLNSLKNSYCDIPSWVDYLNTCKYIGVRGPHSASILRDGGVNQEIKVIGDPALWFADSTVKKKQMTKTIGINLGYTNGNLWGGSDEKIASVMISFIKHLVQSGWHLKFFPVWKEDIPFLTHIIRSAGLIPQEVVLGNYMNVHRFKKELRKVDLFIGEKLHSVILAACTYTPHIMIEYRPKCRDFMESLNLGQYNLRCDKLEPEMLMHLSETIYEKTESIQEYLFTKVNMIRSNLIKEARSIITIIPTRSG